MRDFLCIFIRDSADSVCFVSEKYYLTAVIIKKNNNNGQNPDGFLLCLRNEIGQSEALLSVNFFLF